MRSQGETGYTLVEIMIVVAIIGLLASIATPGFVRARRRSQAECALNELHKVQSGIALYALEHMRTDTDPVGWNEVKDYVKENNPLYARNGKDLLGNPFVFSSVGSGVRLDSATRVYFSGCQVDFSEFQ